jgi:hypothetical protein
MPRAFVAEGEWRQPQALLTLNCTFGTVGLGSSSAGRALDLASG